MLELEFEFDAEYRDPRPLFVGSRHIVVLVPEMVGVVGMVKQVENAQVNDQVGAGEIEAAIDAKINATERGQAFGHQFSHLVHAPPHQFGGFLVEGSVGRAAAQAPAQAEFPFGIGLVAAVQREKVAVVRNAVDPVFFAIPVLGLHYCGADQPVESVREFFLQHDFDPLSVCGSVIRQAGVVGVAQVHERFVQDEHRGLIRIARDMAV